MGVEAQKHDIVHRNTSEQLEMVVSDLKCVKMLDKTLKTMEITRNMKKYEKHSKMSKRGW